jgi:class 3 adenylate cyclase
MFIDMAGYTERSANSSRDGLIDLIRRTREMVEPAARARRGRLVKTMGDGFVVTFESATDAVLAGRDIQRKLAESNVSSDESGKPIDLRIGISTGEVALEQEDVYGEPVNLAARIQQRGTPGEVHFSEATWHAMTRTEVPHEAVGEFELKGISGTIKVFRAL